MGLENHELLIEKYRFLAFISSVKKGKREDIRGGDRVY